MGNTKIKLPGIDGALTSAYVKIPNIDGEIVKIYVGNDLVYQKVVISTITPSVGTYCQISPSTMTTGNSGTQETFYLTFSTPQVNKGYCYTFSEAKLHHGDTVYQLINRTSDPIEPQTTPDLFNGFPYISLPMTYQVEDCVLSCSISRINMKSTSGFSTNVSLTRAQTRNLVTFTTRDIRSGWGSVDDGRYVTFFGQITNSSSGGFSEVLLTTIRWPDRATTEVTIYEKQTTTCTVTLTVNQSGTFTLSVVRNGTSTTIINIYLYLYAVMLW